jgi:hypothetical protein
LLERGTFLQIPVFDLYIKVVTPALRCDAAVLEASLWDYRNDPMRNRGVS